MAEIDLERREHRGTGWLWGLALLALIGAVVWWAWPDDEYALDEEGSELVEPVAEPAPGPVAPLEGIAVSEIRTNPAAFTGRTLSGEVRVADAPTDAGFWIEDAGERLFVLMDPREDAPDIQPNTTIRIENATVHEAAELDRLAGELDEETRTLLQQESVFLTVHPRDVFLQPGMEDDAARDTEDAAVTDTAGGY